jgi:hypothetical protein
MNERIKELIQQATRIVDGGPDMFSMPREIFDKELFAELKIARAIEAHNWADSVYRNLGTAQIYKAAIEKHFGVEE